jgi:NAD(P)-dependent dehydrogenase (short-subunit alcohol dehydrogenase family)
MMRMKPEQWDDVISTNLTSVFYSTQVSCPRAPPPPNTAHATARTAPAPAHQGGAQHLLRSCGSPLPCRSAARSCAAGQLQPCTQL